MQVKWTKDNIMDNFKGILKHDFKIQHQHREQNWGQLKDNLGQCQANIKANIKDNITYELHIKSIKIN